MVMRRPLGGGGRTRSSLIGNAVRDGTHIRLSHAFMWSVTSSLVDHVRKFNEKRNIDNSIVQYTSFELGKRAVLILLVSFARKKPRGITIKQMTVIIRCA